VPLEPMGGAGGEEAPPARGAEGAGHPVTAAAVKVQVELKLLPL
jgi:hypothetical protein